MMNYTYCQRRLLKALIELSPARRHGATITLLSVYAEQSEKAVRNHLKQFELAGLILRRRPYAGVPYRIDLLPGAYIALGVALP